LNAVANPEQVEELRAVISKLHGCDSRHVESVPLHEIFMQTTFWKGIVEVFDLIDHPKAKRCYAWRHLDGEHDESIRYAAVLEIPPVISPQTAVMALAFNDLKHRKK
jgi:hypothetical protein